MRWVQTTLLLLLLPGCRRSELSIPDIESGVSHLAILISSDAGELLGSTAVFPADAVPRVPLASQPDDDSVVRVVGFAEPPGVEGLLRYAGPDDIPLPEVPIRAWSRRFGEEDWASTDPATLALTAEAVLCPRLLQQSEEALLDIDCVSAPCPVRAVQEGCRLRLQASICAPEVPDEVEIGPRGAAVGACAFEGDGPEDARFRLSCGACRIDAHPLPTPEPFDISTASILPDGQAWSGIGFGLAILGRELVVSHDESLSFFDRETLDRLRTEGAPSIVDLLPDPAGAGLVAVTGQGPWSLDRLSVTGAVEASLPLPFGVSFFPERLLFVADRLVVMARRGAGRDGVEMMIVEPATLTLTSSVTERQDVRARAYGVYDEQSVMIGSTKSGLKGVFLYALGVGSVSDRFLPIGGTQGGPSEDSKFLSARPNGLILVSVDAERDGTRFFGGVHILDPAAPQGAGGLTPFANTIEQDAEAAASAVWPADPRYSIVSLVDGEDRAFVGLVDDGFARILPSVTAVPEAGGTAIRVVVGPDDVVYFLHDESGHVVRVAAAP